MPDLGKAFVQIVPSAEGITGAIEKLLGGEAEKAGKSAGGKIASGIGATLAAGAAAVGAGAAAIGKVVAQSVSEYANYEQLVGGVETLFKDSANAVMENADNAFRTAGMSANEYMETVTSFSASLLQSLGGDTAAAAALADQAITDMSDNANKMGSSMESITTAYQGFAKQNFTMLDNLKLGYGGTKTEMARLIEDAEKLDDTFKAQRDEAGELTLSYGDVVNAIHIVQTEMGITGTTAKEAAGTISGSLSSLKASWTNLITGLGSGADLGPLIDNVVSGAETLIGNVLPVAEQALTGVAGLVERLAPMIGEKLPGLVQQILPPLLSAATSLVNSIVAALPGLLGVLASVAPQIITSLVTTIVQNVGPVIEAAVGIVTALASAIGDNLPMLIPMAVEAVTTLATSLTSPDTLSALLSAGLGILQGLVSGILEAIPVLVAALPEIVQNIIDFCLAAIPELMDAGMQMLMGIVEAIPQIIPPLVAAIPQIVDSFVAFIIEGAPMLLEAGITLLMALIDAIPQIIPPLVEALPEIIDAICSGLLENLPALIDAGLQMFMALVEALPEIIVGLVDAAAQIVTALVNAFGEAIPQLWETGKQIVQGLWNGITEAWDWLVDNFKRLVDNLVGGVKEVLGIHSPSTIFEGIGENMALGLGAGWRDGFNGVERDIRNGLAFGGSEMGLALSSGYAGGGETFNITIDAASVKEFNDIVDIAQNARRERRMATA